MLKQRIALSWLKATGVALAVCVPIAACGPTLDKPTTTIDTSTPIKSPDAAPTSNSLPKTAPTK